MNTPAAKLLALRLLFAILCLVFSLAFYQNIRHLRPIVNSYAIGVIIVILILLAWTFVAEFLAWKRSRAEKGAKVDAAESDAADGEELLAWSPQWLKTFYAVAGLFAYIYLISLLGYYAASGLFLLTLFFLLRVRPLVAILLAPTLVLVAYLVFSRLFDIPLPRGMFF